MFAGRCALIKRIHQLTTRSCGRGTGYKCREQSIEMLTVVQRVKIFPELHLEEK
jgi:hypothetical protein